MTSRPLVFATRNPGKLVELRQLVSAALSTSESLTPAPPGRAGRSNIRVVSIDEAVAQLGRDIADVVEDQPTFVGNATKKAREVSYATGWPALADDSGLEVDALDGAPGVYSARYADVEASESRDEANNLKLLRKLSGIPAARRTARFRATLAFADVRGPLGERVITADGTCEGTILEQPRGTGGFGYDPLFFSPELGKTFAEAGVGPKGNLSHRARAIRAILPQLLDYFVQIRDRRGE